MPETRRMKLEPIDIKLLILYLLKEADQPLSAGDIADFMTAESFLDFFETHHYIGLLSEERQIEKTPSETYQLTEEGSQAISFFENRIPYSILEKIQLKTKLLKKQKFTEQLVTSDYIPLSGDEFQVQLTMRETPDAVPFEIRFTVTGKEMAKNICRHWKENYASLYMQLTGLFSQT